MDALLLNPDRFQQFGERVALAVLFLGILLTLSHLLECSVTFLGIAGRISSIINLLTHLKKSLFITLCKYTGDGFYPAG